jgi:hypothetical protein
MRANSQPAAGKGGLIRTSDEFHVVRQFSNGRYLAQFLWPPIATTVADCLGCGHGFHAARPRPNLVKSPLKPRNYIRAECRRRAPGGAVQDH